MYSAGIPHEIIFLIWFFVLLAEPIKYPRRGTSGSEILSMINLGKHFDVFGIWSVAWLGEAEILIEKKNCQTKWFYD